MKYALRSSVCTALLLTGAGTSLAMAQNVPGEKWKITSTMQMGGMSMPGMNSEICKQPGDESVPIKTEDNCTVYDNKRVGNVQSFKMRCTGKDAMEGSAQFTYLGADHYQGKMQVTTQGETMNMNYEGRKIGACDGGEINLQAEKLMAKAEQQKAQADRQVAQNCHQIAADAQSPMVMRQLCTDPADVKTFCAAAQTHQKFQAMSKIERLSSGSSPDERPLTESGKLCNYSVEAKRTQLCSSAEAQGNFNFIATDCPAQVQALAAAQCAGRSYTAISDKYRDFCSDYATASAQAQSQPETAGGKAKGLLNKGKKALGGIFSN